MERRSGAGGVIGRLGVGVLAAMLLSLGACSYTREPAAAALTARGADGTVGVSGRGIEWPSRRTEGLPSGERRMKFRAAEEGAGGKEGGAPPGISVAWVQELWPLGQGLVVANRTEVTGEGGETFGEVGGDWSGPGFDGGFSFFTFRADRPFPRMRRSAGGEERPLDVRGLRRRAVLADEFHVRTPVAEAWPPKGIALVKHGLGGLEYTRPVANELLRRGWVVVESEGLSWGFERVERALEEEDREARGQGAGDARSTKPKAMTVDEASTTFAQGAQLFADIAYSWEAALAFVEKKCAAAAGGPVVYVGMSFGGIVGPTVVARLGERVKATVLAGAGANLMGIASESDIEGLDLVLTGSDGRRVMPGSEHYRAISEMYLEKAAWDSYNTAPFLAGQPVLLVQGRTDRTVPSQYGELLWERLGRPERWSAWYGHPLLIYFIGDHRKEIVDWLERHVREAAGEGGASREEGAPSGAEQN
ncbi:MAG: hypothetical protein JNL50_04510 [Phycisphaerae bacterium]|nr:hypothetical protein [Phycisphaerae bacterium]